MNLKRILPYLLTGFVLIALTRAIGLWDDGLAFTAVNHGDHKHYMPKEKDANVGLDDCPSHPPAPDSFLSSQCQIIRKVTQGNTTYYVPEQVAENAVVTSFPTKPPAKGERISPTGQIEKAE